MCNFRSATLSPWQKDFDGSVSVCGKWCDVITIVVKFETFRIGSKFQSSFNAKESVQVFIWRPLNVGVTVAYLFNTVLSTSRKLQTCTFTMFFTVPHASRLRFFACTSFSHFELYGLYFISFKVHKLQARNKVHKVGTSQLWIQGNLRWVRRPLLGVRACCQQWRSRYGTCADQPARSTASSPADRYHCPVHW